MIALNDSGEHTSRTRLSLVLGDVQFWVPVVVLLGGLLVLRWVH